MDGRYFVQVLVPPVLGFGDLGRDAKAQLGVGLPVREALPRSSVGHFCHVAPAFSSVVDAIPAGALRDVIHLLGVVLLAPVVVAAAWKSSEPLYDNAARVPRAAATFVVVVVVVHSMVL